MPNWTNFRAAWTELQTSVEYALGEALDREAQLEAIRDAAFDADDFRRAAFDLRNELINEPVVLKLSEGMVSVPIRPRTSTTEGDC